MPSEGIAIDHLVLFPTDNEAAAVAEGLGVAFFRHESFGNFPKEEAKNYGDNTFVQMMWIKVLCVYLPLNLGYHVLFQDADVVWLKDPIHDYFLKPEVGPSKEACNLSIVATYIYMRRLRCLLFGLCD